MLLFKPRHKQTLLSQLLSLVRFKALSIAKVIHLSYKSMSLRKECTAERLAGDSVQEAGDSALEISACSK